MEPTALPAQALPKLACPCRGSGAGDMGGGRETYADAGQAQVDGVLEILDAGERAPRVGLEGGPAEQHAVANQVGAHAKPSATREANSMEQQEPGCDELGSSRAELVREHRVVGLDYRFTTTHRGLELGQQVVVGHRVGVHDDHGVGLIRRPEKLVEGPT